MGTSGCASRGLEPEGTLPLWRQGRQEGGATRSRARRVGGVSPGGANKPCAAVHCAPQAYACPSRTCGIAGQGQMLAIAPSLDMRLCAQGGGGQGARGAFRGHFSGLAAWHRSPRWIYFEIVMITDHI